MKSVTNQANTILQDSTGTVDFLKQKNTAENQMRSFGWCTKKFTISDK